METGKAIEERVVVSTSDNLHRVCGRWGLGTTIYFWGILRRDPVVCVMKGGNQSQASGLSPISWRGKLARAKITQIAMGDYHFLFRSSTGDVYVVGTGSEGQLGCGINTIEAARPTLLSKIPPVVYVVAQASYSVAMTANGSFYIWGRVPHSSIRAWRPYKIYPGIAGTDRKNIKSSGHLGSNKEDNNKIRLKPVGSSSHSRRKRRIRANRGERQKKGQSLVGRIKQIRVSDKPDVLRCLRDSSRAKKVRMRKFCALGGSANAIIGVSTCGEIVIWGTCLCGKLHCGFTLFTLPTLVKGDRVKKVSLTDNYGIILTNSGYLWAFGRSTYGEVAPYEFLRKNKDNNTLYNINVSYDKFTIKYDNSTLSYGDDNYTIFNSKCCDLTCPRLFNGKDNRGNRIGFIRDASTGPRHTLILTHTGRVLAFGDNTRGQCGLPESYGTRIKIPRGVKFPSQDSAIAVFCGNDHSGAITQLRHICLWGPSDSYKLIATNNYGAYIKPRTDLKAPRVSGIKDAFSIPRKINSLIHLNILSACLGNNATVIAVRMPVS